MAVGDELVHRHQLDRRDAEPLQVRDHRRVGQAQIGAALLVGNDRVLHGQPADVRLVDHGLVVRDARWLVPDPVEVRAYHDRARHAPRRVDLTRPIPGEHPVVAEQSVISGGVPLDRLGVRVEQQLARVTQMALYRIPRAMHPVPVPLARADAGQVPVPDEPVDLVQVDPRLGAVVVEQAELDPVGYLGEEGEVGPGSVIRGPQRIAVTRPYGSRHQLLPIPPSDRPADQPRFSQA